MKLPLLHSSLLSLDPAWSDRVAVKSSKGELVYQQLQSRAFQIANWLSANSCVRGDRVAICIPKSLESVQMIMGALVGGITYVPIDYKAPPARVQAIVNDSGAKIVLVLSDMADGLAAIGGVDAAIVCVPGVGDGTGIDGLLAAHVASPPAGAGELDDIAAMLYTSGTTGVPKGVMLSQENISSFVQWTVDTFNFTINDRLTSHAPFHFDLSTMDLFTTFRVGASVFLLDDMLIRFPSSISKIIEKEKITSWYSVPTALRLLLEHGALDRRDISSLRQVFFAGEVFPMPTLRSVMQAMPGVEFINLYGPTETNVCTYHRLPGIPEKDMLAIPIGLPCEHLEVFLLDDNGVLVEGEGQGEICARGPGVMRGYWKRDELTAAARVNGEANTYRTGDYGAWNADGTIRFGGRRDAQIKIRGFRVELSEIESVIVADDRVKEAVVNVIHWDGAEDQLVAFVVPIDPQLSEADLMAQCARLLPPYAQPHKIIFKDDFPRTSTGKIDRVQLNSVAVSLSA